MGLITRHEELRIIAALGSEQGIEGGEVVLAQLLCCPITGLLMRDPVVGTDGFIYDRRALVAWYAHFGAKSVLHPFLEERLHYPLNVGLGEGSLPQMQLMMSLDVDVDYHVVHRIYLPLDDPNHVFTRSRFKACLDKGDVEYRNDGTGRAILWVKAMIMIKLGLDADKWLTTITEKGLSAMVKARLKAKENGRGLGRLQRHHIPTCNIMKDEERIVDPVLDSSFNIYNRAAIDEWFAKQVGRDKKGMYHEIVSSTLVGDRGADLLMWGKAMLQQYEESIASVQAQLNQAITTLQKTQEVRSGRITCTPRKVNMNLKHIEEAKRVLLADQMVVVLRGRLIDDKLVPTLEDLRVMSLKNMLTSCSAVVSYEGKALASGSLKQVAAYMFFKFDALTAELRYFIQTTVLGSGAPGFAMQAEAATFLRGMMCHGKEKSAIWQLGDDELKSLVAECGEVRSSMETLQRYYKTLDQICDTNEVHFFDKIVGHHKFNDLTDDHFKEDSPFLKSVPSLFSEAAQKINDICIRKYEPCDNARTGLSNAVVAIYINNMGRLLKEGSVSFINEVEAMKMLAFVVRAFSATYAEKNRELSITINEVYCDKN